MTSGKIIPSPSQPDYHFNENVDNKLDMYSTYEKFLLSADFDGEISDHHVETFFDQYEHIGLKYLEHKLYRFIFDKHSTSFSKY